MKKYIVPASEVVYYEIEVEAESAEEAERLVQDGEIKINLKPVDSSDFEVGEAQEVK